MDFVVLALTRSSTSSRYDKNLILKRNHQIHVVQAYSYSYVFHALLPPVCCAVLGREKVCVFQVYLPVRAFHSACVSACLSTMCLTRNTMLLLIPFNMRKSSPYSPPAFKDKKKNCWEERKNRNNNNKSNDTSKKQRVVEWQQKKLCTVRM